MFSVFLISLFCFKGFQSHLGYYGLGFGFLKLMVLGRMVDDGHDSNLRITKSQGSFKYVADYEHHGNIGVENGDGRWRGFPQ
jgi:hypothetical protein